MLLDNEIRRFVCFDLFELFGEGVVEKFDLYFDYLGLYLLKFVLLSIKFSLFQSLITFQTCSTINYMKIPRNK